MMLEPQPKVRIKLNGGMVAGAIAIVLLVIASFSRKTDPHSSSFALVSALLMLFSMATNFASPKIQTFLHRRGYRLNTMNGCFYGSDSGVYGSDSGGSMDSGIGCSFGDGGGCDGGGGG